ncbi:MAG: hypothetical protein GW903_01310 [Alphaproteobacteria bacterium]|nr:hypothetical protein [Alphaproteobacteria bacterium]NCQ87609.1 hypothetical protein [Alphaproteobacteria bacterium]NCT05882.1 hypothetical protein [Alphaproteobacteria bacterium]
MFRFLEFLGLVTLFFIMIYAGVYFASSSSDQTTEETASQLMLLEPAYENLTLAQGQCSVITMYSMSWCGYCRIKREEFKQNNIAFREFVLDEDPAANAAFSRKMKDLRIRKYGYPTFFINDKYVLNYPTDYLIKQTCS